MRLSIYMLNKTYPDMTVISDFIIREDETNKMKQTVYRKSLKKQEIFGYDDNVSALLFYEEIMRSHDWINNINEILQKGLIKNDWKVYRAVIIFKINRRFIALSFNGGIHLIQDKYIDEEFGLNIVQKLIKKEEILEYSSIGISETIINTKKQSNINIPYYQINNRDDMSIIRSISGKTDLNGKKISGMRNLDLDFSGDLKKDLIPLLREIIDIYYLEELGPDNILIKNKVNEVKNIELKKKLDLMLVDQIKELVQEVRSNHEINVRSIKNFKFNIPNYLDGKYESFKITGLRYNYTEIKMHEYMERLADSLRRKNKEVDNNYILKKIKRDKIIMLDANGESGPELTIYKSLVAEYNLEDSDCETAILISGKWYLVNKDYYKLLSESLKSAINLNSEIKNIKFLDRRKSEDELEFNERLAIENEAELLDEKWYRFEDDLKGTTLNKRSKIEPCDVLKYDDQGNLIMIHSKIGLSPAPISHLSTQANISTELILHKKSSENFINKINELCGNGKGIPLNITREKITVILLIILKDNKKIDKNVINKLTILNMRSLFDSIHNISSQGVNVVLKFVNTIE